VAAENILLPLDADGGSAHTPWHRVRGSTGTCRGAVLSGLWLALLAGWWTWLPWLSGSAAKARPVCDRVIRDGELLTQIRRVHADKYGVYGAPKVWLQLHRENSAWSKWPRTSR
jgi:hypothetical protein